MTRFSFAALTLGLFLAGAQGSLHASDDASGKSKFPHVRLGGISVGAGYSHFSGPFWGPWAYPYWATAWPAYSPLLYSPYFAPGYFTGFGYQSGYGEVKLKSIPKTATIFIDGAYAGSAEKLKQMWLEPGVYQLQVHDGSQTLNRKVYVLSGKTLQLSRQDLLQSND